MISPATCQPHLQAIEKECGLTVCGLKVTLIQKGLRQSKDLTINTDCYYLMLPLSFKLRCLIKKNNSTNLSALAVFKKFGLIL